MTSQPGRTGSIVRAEEIPARRDADGASVRMLLDTGSGQPGLARHRVDISPGLAFSGTTGAAGELWFVIEGAGQADIAGQPGVALKRDRGLWIPPGSDFRVLAGGDELRLDVVSLPPAGDESPAGQGADVSTVLSRDFADCEIETTGDRQFRVLFGPGKGCAVATQFVGQIPPGRAPEHSHPYDEVVLILQGQGVAHIDGGEHSLAPGTCIHLPPGLPHCLENTGPVQLRVLGVFHPADSPAAKLLSGR